MFEKWITNGTAVPFYARKQFEVKKEVKAAQAKVCGLGQFLFSMNGKKIGDHELDPAWTAYDKNIQYVTFDVTNQIQIGINVIGVEVGNGWFIKMDEHYTFNFPEFMPPNPNPYQPFGKVLVLALKLKLEYEDGTTEVIQADESFKTAAHPVVMSNVYGSETKDGRLIQHGWNTNIFDESNWENAKVVDKRDEPKGKLGNQFQPPVKVIKTYEGKQIGIVKGKEIYDFTQNISGMLEFQVWGKRGDIIHIYPAEKLGDDGDVDQYAKNWTMVDSCITYIIGRDNSWETFRMKFTYFAGRFVAIEKIKTKGNEKREDIAFQNLRADAISSAFQTNGTFTCDDERYIQIYDMIEKSVEANMLGVHTDCPTIERFAWQEPNHLMASSIFYMKNGNLLWKKFLEDMRYAQLTKEDYFLDIKGEKYYPGNGLMPSQCPCYIPNVLPVPGMGSFYDIIPWGSTSILGTYWHYRFYGDISIIEENYAGGMKYLCHLKSKMNNQGFINHGLGDWGNPKNELSRENIETVFLYADALILSEFAKVLEKKEDYEQLKTFSEEVKKNYNKKLLKKHPKEGYWCYPSEDHPKEFYLTQSSQALPLFWGMVPKQKEMDVVKALRDTLEKENAFICGEVGLPYVIQAMRMFSMDDLISKFILKKEHPSYYAFILDGETTLGEYWEKNPRSHCHDMMGHIIEWYYNGIAGINALEPGFKKVKIMPFLPESIHEFTCSYESVHGLITVSVVENEKQKLILKVGAPSNIEVKIDCSKLEARGKVQIIKE